MCTWQWWPGRWRQATVGIWRKILNRDDDDTLRIDASTRGNSCVYVGGGISCREPRRPFQGRRRRLPTTAGWPPPLPTPGEQRSVRAVSGERSADGTVIVRVLSRVDVCWCACSHVSVVFPRSYRRHRHRHRRFHVCALTKYGRNSWNVYPFFRVHPVIPQRELTTYHTYRRGRRRQIFTLFAVAAVTRDFTGKRINRFRPFCVRARFVHSSTPPLTLAVFGQVQSHRH